MVRKTKRKKLLKTDYKNEEHSFENVEKSTADTKGNKKAIEIFFSIKP